MKVRSLKLAVVLFALLLGGLVAMLQVDRESPSKDESAISSLGDAHTLLAAYNRWKARTVQNGGDRKLTLSLRYSKGLSAEFTKGHGQVTLDLVDGSFSAEISGLPNEEAFDVWLIDNRPGPGHSVKPEPGDVMLHVGPLRREDGTATLQAHLARETLAGFELDLVVVARAGEGPEKAGLLFGSPSLFQRLYQSEQRGQFATVGGPAPFRVLIPSLAYADKGGKPNLNSFINRGRRLFFEETFRGNGRTCGTCHPANNNLTIDPDFIDTLPCDDPLFVAEHAADRNACPQAAPQDPSLASLERPMLMREVGLILENVDGFDDLENKFVMRGVPHTLALGTSITPRTDNPFGVGNTVPPVDRTGWSGDGSPGEGSLRSFATGAVIQHFPKTLNRIPGVDFRLPTDKQLDALEAFQLSLGRQGELDLNTLLLNIPLAAMGQQLFVDNSLGKCNLCHGNAGAGQVRDGVLVNPNFNTGVENILDQPADRIDPANNPPDGGFGGQGLSEPNRDCDGDTVNDCFGDGSFNTPPVVEAADTGPFFHNNALSTIEEAVEFYISDAFNETDIAGAIRGISLTTDEIEAIAAFLRVINALENIRAAIASETRALGGGKDARNALGPAIADTDDAITVLERGDLGSLDPDAVALLQEAKGLLEFANQIRGKGRRRALINEAIAKQEEARNRVCQPGSDAVLC